MNPLSGLARSSMSLSLSLALAGCGVPTEDPAEARALMLGLDRCPTAEVFAPGVISGPGDEGRLSLSSDGDTAYFHRVGPSGLLTLMTATRGHRGWSTPRPLALSGSYNDLDPFLSADGGRLFFASDRPDDTGPARDDFDLFVAARQGDGFGPPRRIAATSTAHNELFPSLTSDGTLYFNSDRPGGQGEWDLYSAVRAGAGFQPPRNLGSEINSEHWEFNPAVHPSGKLIVFGSIGRPDSRGASDLYMSVKWGGRWLAPWNLGPCVNTEGPEYHPALHRGSLYFIRFTEGAAGDVYRLSF